MPRPIFALLLIPLPAFAQATFQNLGVGTYAAMSRNGQHILTVGINSDVLHWSASTKQITPLGLNLGTSGFPTAISDDGRIVAGFHRNSLNQTMAFRWTPTNGLTDLGDLPGGSTYSLATDMSADGNVIVGTSASTASGTRDEAFRWIAATGMQPLGDLPGGNYTSNANAVSADGATIAGYSHQSSGFEAFRYTATAGMVGLGEIPGGPFNSQAYAVSSDGSVIAGYSSDAQGREQAFRWTQAGGLIPLGIASNDLIEWSQARAINADGTVIVGNNNTGITPGDIKAIIWDPAHGMRHLQTAMVSDFGLSLPGWRLTGAWDVSDDGRTFAGSGLNPSNQRESWVISIVPEPATSLLPLLVLTFLARGQRPRGAG